MVIEEERNLSDEDYAGTSGFGPLAATPEFATRVNAGLNHALHHYVTAFGAAVYN